MAAIPADRRYVRGRRCPVCDGADQDPRGVERRCYGFLSEDGQFAHCSREEHAGTLKLSEGSQTYGHRRAGPCGCGAQHADPEPRAAQPHRRIVREYDYIDEHGAMLYQVVRFEPKTFRQRRRGPDGQWIWNLEGTRRVLYHLDRIIESDPEQIVYIVEGEKDVEALESIGLVATCNPQGAGKWSCVDECARDALRDRRVVVISDSDDRGRAHAEDVIARLRGVATVLRPPLELPGAKDAADWVALGGTAEQLAALVVAPVAAAATAAVATVPALDPETPFDRDEDNRIYHSQKNIALALAKLGVTVRYDEFAGRNTVDGLAGYGPHLDDIALNRLRLQIDARFHFRPSKEFFYDVVTDQAYERRWHPVREHLDALRWDGRPRVEGWLTTYAGAPDTAYTRAVGRIFLVAAVRRVREPGCVYQELVILESKQGKNKSTALAILAGEREWFTDDLPLGADTRRLMESTTGRWIVEAGELKGMSRADVSQLKAYLSRTKDEARMAYGREKRTVLRQFVPIGTINETGGYLRDQTGNRRFWPVPIVEFDIARLRADRDQLWAEASHLELHGASIRLDPSLYEEAAVEQDDRSVTDPMDILLSRAFGDITGKVRTADAWRVLGNSERPLTQDEMTRFAQSMRRLGWVNSRRRVGNGEREYCYVRGSKSESDTWLIVDGSGHQAVVRHKYDSF